MASLRPTPCDTLVKQFKEDNPSCHIFKIENFSLLNKYQIKQVESSVFNISGHKWKLILHPEGNEQDKGKGHVSLYLKYQDLGQIKATVQVFILSQKEDSMISRQGIVNFDKSNKKWGAPRLITIDNLKDSGEEYLMGNCSIFGVKLSGSTITNEPATAESFSLIENPPNNKVTWKMGKYSAFNQETGHMSHEFVIGNRKWRLQIYPRGSYEPKGRFLSLFLRASTFVDNTPKTKTYAKYTLKLLNQKDGLHHTGPVSYWFLEEDNRYGWPRFMPLGDLNIGFLVDNVLYVGVEMDVVSVTRYC